MNHLKHAINTNKAYQKCSDVQEICLIIYFLCSAVAFFSLLFCSLMSCFRTFCSSIMKARMILSITRMNIRPTDYGHKYDSANLHMAC